MHWYGKEGETKGRKLGHATVLLTKDNPTDRQIEAESALRKIRSIWPMPSDVID